MFLLPDPRPDIENIFKCLLWIIYGEQKFDHY